MEGAFWDALHEGVKNGAFREVETPGDETAMGWVSIEDFTDDEFSGASYMQGNYVGLSLRVDSAKVPQRILEIHMRKEVRAVMERTGQKRLSAGQRRELKENLKEALKKQVLPSIQVTDLIWDTSRSIVYFGSHSMKAMQRVEEHFKKCFGLSLIPLIPYIRAEELLKDKKDRRLLESLEPCSMIP
jgi:DNA recombination-dependent growth factor C